MRRILPLAVCTVLLIIAPSLYAQNEGMAIDPVQAPTPAQDQELDVEVDTAVKTPDASVAKKLDLMSTPYTVDDDGDYRILVNVADERSQLVWVRSVVHETDEQRLREIWTYGLRSEDRRIPIHIANRLLSENMDLIVGAWARQDGNAVLILKINADADAKTLDEAIDLAASIGDRMEQRLVTGDEL